jgi:hypothetical protein
LGSHEQLQQELWQQEQLHDVQLQPELEQHELSLQVFVQHELFVLPPQPDGFWFSI